VNLGFDIDGVIANFAVPLIEVIEKRYSLTLAEKNLYCFNLNVVLGITKEEETLLINDVLKEEIPLYVGAKETLEQLSKEGHSILLLTGRWSHLLSTTQSWLKQNGISYDELHFLEIGKKHQANIKDLDVIVEDSLEDALEWNCKVKNILIYDQPYNQTFNVKRLTKRVYNWREIYSEIQLLQSVGETR